MAHEGAVGGLGAFLGGVRAGQVQERQLGLREQQEQRLATFQSGQQDINLSRLKLQQEEFTFKKETLAKEQTAKADLESRILLSRTKLSKGLSTLGVVRGLTGQLVNPSAEGVAALDAQAQKHAQEHEPGFKLTAGLDGNIALLTASDEAGESSIQMMPENVSAFANEGKRDFAQGWTELFLLNEMTEGEFIKGMKDVLGPPGGGTAGKNIFSGSNIGGGKFVILNKVTGKERVVAIDLGEEDGPSIFAMLRRVKDSDALAKKLNDIVGGADPLIFTSESKNAMFKRALELQLAEERPPEEPGIADLKRAEAELQRSRVRSAEDLRRFSITGETPLAPVAE